MTAMHFLRLCLWGYLTLAVAGCAPKEEGPPNIIFILADDLGWADLPAYGNAFNEAPNISRLASQGKLFTNAYAAAPVCSPTRASIQSGQYPARTGIIDFIPGHWRPYEKLRVASNKTQFLPSDIHTLGELMRDAGYATGYFGKWHLGGSPEHLPESQGYNESVVYRGGGYFGFGEKLHPPQDIPPQKILSEALTDLGLRFIEKNRENPFFLFLAHYDVHVQLDADTALIHKYLGKEKAGDYPSNAIYAAMVEHVDNSVGSVMDKLEELELEDNTMVVFFSDNGGLVSRYDKIPLIANSKKHYYEDDTLLYVASSNYPLRSEKGTVFEGGIREPLIIKWPGKVSQGSTSDALITSVDFFPTFAALTGAKLPNNQVLDGKSILPELTGGDVDPQRAIYWHYPVYHHDVPASVVRKGEWKLIHFLDDNHLELYNLQEDIGETTDLAEKYPDKVDELEQLLNNWRQEVNAQMPEMNPDFDPQKREKWGRHPYFDRKSG